MKKISKKQKEKMLERKKFLDDKLRARAMILATMRCSYSSDPFDPSYYEMREEHDEICETLNIKYVPRWRYDD